MATKLFDTKDRNASHAKLAEILAGDPKSRAECREDNDAGVFQVWDGPEDSARAGQAASQTPEEIAKAEAANTEALADLVAEKLFQKMARASEATKAGEPAPQKEGDA